MMLPGKSSRKKVPHKDCPSPVDCPSKGLVANVMGASVSPPDPVAETVYTVFGRSPPTVVI